MTTQKEIDGAFISTLESIIGICDKTTSSNVSHNIAGIKGKCREMLQFYRKFPATFWHSITDGDLPEKDILVNHTLIVFGAGFGFEYDVSYIAKDRCFGFGIYNGFDDEDDFEVIDGVEYWMEIPSLPKESEVSNG